MKRILLYLCAGVLALGFTACGDKAGSGSQNGSAVQGSSSGQASAGGQGSSSGQASAGGQVSSSSQENAGGQESSPAQDGSAGQPEGDGAGAEGWSQEMEELKTAVTDALGENYWPNMPLDGEMFAAFFGVAADLYEDYLAEMPMIGAHVDTLVVVKAKEGKADEVEAALNAYRDAKISDTMQYPMNLGKIQASRVDKIGNYVLFVQLGGDTTEAMDISDDAVIQQCQEANGLVVETIKGKLGQ